ncbi:cobalamin B12-binding domain-containing protein [Chloroflexus sp.]|uniref:cobalamin B12-binding domain-containing protein n=1 Tax=Chloroflexus sp. TaxID=1904827 RepID=UPI00262A4CBC|nr:cobalamin-dependent protein [uncultured Chloroflexus sp.]
MMNWPISSEFQQRYLEAMLQGSGRAADRVIEQALAQGVHAPRIYLDIFQPTAYEIGRLWQINRIGVAQEHLATAIIERQMGELHPYFQPKIKRNRRIVLGCAPDEWHRVGIRMVADFFEAEGWEVIYLGAAVPIPAFIDAIKTTHPDLVGISAAMVFHLPHLTSLTRALAAADLDGIPLMVGGLPFARQPDLHRALNIQLSAPNAAAAVLAANQSFPTPPQPLRVSHSEEAFAALRAHRRQIINRATDLALQHSPEERDPNIVTAGYEFVTRMLEAALAVERPELLDEQILWGNERQPRDGVLPEQILRRLEIYDSVIRQLLPAEIATIVGAYTNRMVALQRSLLGQE